MLGTSTPSHPGIAGGLTGRPSRSPPGRAGRSRRRARRSSRGPPLEQFGESRLDPLEHGLRPLLDLKRRRELVQRLRAEVADREVAARLPEVPDHDQPGVLVECEDRCRPAAAGLRVTFELTSRASLSTPRRCTTVERATPTARRVRCEWSPPRSGSGRGRILVKLALRSRHHSSSWLESLVRSWHLCGGVGSSRQLPGSSAEIGLDSLGAPSRSDWWADEHGRRRPRSFVTA